MPILVGIDGTGGDAAPGAGRNARYDAAFANSFVTRLCRNKNYAGYWRGPVALGGGLVPAINGAVEYVENRRRNEPNAPVLLTGYSRGAAGVVVVAKRLQRKNIDVRAMLLFDCVDRHLFIDAEEIPNNVGFVMHVVRDPAGGSRGSFGNDGMRYSPPTVYPAAYKFLCTHGGMGGTPWTIPAGKTGSDLIEEGFPDGRTRISYDNDKKVSGEVWNFVRPFIRLHGFA